MYGVNSIRFGGIASGIDTEGIIKQLMNLEQTKLDRFNQQKQLLEWKRTDYRSINNQLRSFREGVNLNLRLSSTFMSKNASVSNNSIFNATATANAAVGNYSFEVMSLAKGVTVDGDIASTQSVEDFFTSNNIVGDELTFAINGTSVTINKSDQMDDIVNKINAVSGDTGVKAIYEPGMERFFLYTENTGAAANITISGDANNFVSGVLGLSPDSGGVLGWGENAKLKFNGIDVEFASNKFEFIGINFELKKATPGEVVNVQVDNNLDRAVDEIKAFVEAYNKIIDDLSTKLGEKRYRDYPPLTEAQKKDMTEKDIEKWEEQARSGLFRSDTMLMNIASTLRMTVNDMVSGLEGKYKSLSSIGISTSSDWNDSKLYIDENKLRAALNEDLEGVSKIFNNNSDDPKSQGIAQKLDGQISAFYERIASTAGRPTAVVDESYLGKEINDLDDRIKTMQNRMIMLEEKYWRQFTAMETALHKMQSQSDWFMAQLGQG